MRQKYVDMKQEISSNTPILFSLASGYWVEERLNSIGYPITLGNVANIIRFADDGGQYVFTVENGEVVELIDNGETEANAKKDRRSDNLSILGGVIVVALITLGIVQVLDIIEYFLK